MEREGCPVEVFLRETARIHITHGDNHENAHAASPFGETELPVFSGLKEFGAVFLKKVYQTTTLSQKIRQSSSFAREFSHPLFSALKSFSTFSHKYEKLHLKGLFR
ncbi:hypothetical protein X975_06158, partial [Stegodyphus mimosarum]